jgi:hypothetical protein
MRAGIIVKVTRADRHRLEAIVSDRSAPQKYVWRANIILATVDGCGTPEIMRRSGKSKPVVWRWKARFMAEGVEGLTRDKTRKPGSFRRPRGRPHGREDRHRGRRVFEFLGELRVVRQLERADAMRRELVGFENTLHRTQAHPCGFRQHPTGPVSCFSRRRPERQVDRSQIQALDRTQPGLPMKPGRAGTMTHDYKRHGTTTLFAALNILDGTVIGRNMQRHLHQEFIRFLNTIEEQVPAGKVIHAIVDNYATNKHPRVRAAARFSLDVLCPLTRRDRSRDRSYRETHPCLPSFKRRKPPARADPWRWSHRRHRRSFGSW